MPPVALWTFGDFANELDFAAFSFLDSISFLHGLITGPAPGHQPMFDEQVVDKELDKISL